MNSPSNRVFRWKRPRPVLVAYGLLGSAGAVLAALAILSVPADPKNSLFLGLSLQRVGLIGGTSLLAILLTGLAVKAHRDEAWAGGLWSSLFGSGAPADGIRWASLAGLLAGWTASFTPPYRFGIFQDHFLRLHPIIAWLTFFSALTFVIAWAEKYGLRWPPWESASRAEKQGLRGAAIAVLIFALLWALIAWTGLGIRTHEDYWYGAGVPLLGLQIALALMAGVGVFLLERSLPPRRPARADLLICVLLWGLSAFLWVREPLPPSFFAPDPRPPNYEYYPFSDAATFDLGSQFALIGQGLNNGVFYDRALYMEFLLILHVLAGQDYIRLVAWQSAIFAVFPAILYLLGKAVHSRPFGASLAVLAALRGVNGIAASTMFDLANQKQMLTDFPTAIGAALFTYLLVKWLKAPARDHHYAPWAGGVLGLTTLLRTNALLLLPLAILLAAVAYWRQWRPALLTSLLVMAAMLASILPWGLQSGGSIFDVYLLRMRDVILRRYLPPTPSPTPHGGASPSFGLADWSGEAPPPASFAPLADAPAGEAGSIPVPAFLPTHFLHNLVASAFILPTSPVLHDLRHTVKEVNPYWEQYWDGSLGVSAGFFLALNLLLIALGIGAAWGSVKLPGLAPLGAFLFYDLADAFARTSGGRYVVPMDWIVLFYFVLGLFQVILWGMALFGIQGSLRPAETGPHAAEGKILGRGSLRKTAWILLTFLLIGASLPSSARFFPRRYAPRSEAETLAALEGEGRLREMGFDEAALKAFLEGWPAATLSTGRALYPRHYPMDRGEPTSKYPYRAFGFPRIVFTMVGPDGLSGVILPSGRIPYFPNAADVIVLGCRGSDYIDALAVVVIGERTAAYVRRPPAPLQCPLQQPVCDQYHVCR